MPDDRELRLALEHPRGTEQRRLGPFRDALNDPARYAALPVAQRDLIVAWAALRETMAERGVDNDATNLADPLIPAERLIAFVLAGERVAARGTNGREHGIPVVGPLTSAVAQLRGS